MNSCEEPSFVFLLLSVLFWIVAERGVLIVLISFHGALALTIIRMIISLFLVDHAAIYTAPPPPPKNYAEIGLTLRQRSGEIIEGGLVQTCRGVYNDE